MLKQLFRWVNQWRRNPAQTPQTIHQHYPDYVVCPHCNEPEVEVWCYANEAHCHNCAQAFKHTPPPGCVR